MHRLRRKIPPLRRTVYLLLLLLALCLNAYENVAWSGIQTQAPDVARLLEPFFTWQRASRPPGTADLARLLIVSIHVNAAIELVGVGADGNMETPMRDPWKDVGWYRQGPQPGDPGSAVIDGHLDQPGGAPAVFWRLGDLRPGDLVQIKYVNGRTRVFRVTSLAYYQPEKAPLMTIFERRGGTYLNLITCAGDWLPSQHQTSLRLVVFTTLLPGR